MLSGGGISEFEECGDVLAPRVFEDADVGPLMEKPRRGPLSPAVARPP